MELVERPWRFDAACASVDPDLFFPRRGEEGSSQAKAVCATCPVRQDCLDAAILEGERYGIWGGLNYHERVAYRKAQGIAQRQKQSTAEHGTEAGYARHRRAGETPCGVCKSAHADYKRNRKLQAVS
jgi:WhiB family redox-sensing transcriptional regulator